MVAVIVFFLSTLILFNEFGCSLSLINSKLITNGCLKMCKELNTEPNRITKKLKLISSLRKKINVAGTIKEQDSSIENKVDSYEKEKKMLLDFDDSVFDKEVCEDNDITSEEKISEVIINEKNVYSRGDKILAKITGYGSLGASVKISKFFEDRQNQIELKDMTGLILRDELDYYASVHGSDPAVGTSVPAYVLKVRQDQKIDVSLRPVGYDKVLIILF